MRKKLSRVLYLLLVDLLGGYLVVVPVYAFQVSSSTTGYVRTLPSSGASAMLATHRASSIASIASAASAGGGSLALRLVTGAGWVGLGVTAGLLLYEAYYSPTELAAVKAAASPSGLVIEGVTLPPGSEVHACPGGSACGGLFPNTLEYVVVFTPPSLCNPVAAGPVPPHWAGWYSHPVNGCLALRTSAMPLAQPAAPQLQTPTPGDIAATLQALPAADPLSIESHTTPAGVGVAGTPADQVVSQPVPASQVTTNVVPASQVGPTDVVVNKDATAPAGPVPTQTATQTSTTTNTTTTTTITNPDGSTTTTSTTTETEEAPVSSCSTGNHEQRTFGGILQDHMDRWQGSGLLSALNLLTTLTWPTTMPTYSLQSNLLGTFTLDFSAWSGMLTAIRSIIIAIAGFVAYRIIFVGAR